MAPFALLLCGGEGRRFGGVTPFDKPCVPVFGRPVHDWVLASLTAAATPLRDVVVAVPEGAAGENLVRRLARAHPTLALRHVALPYQTRGPAETVLLALTALTALTDLADRPFWVLDNDVVYDAATPWCRLAGSDGSNASDGDAVAVLTASTPRPLGVTDGDGSASPYGHVVTSAVGDAVTRIVEKAWVSDRIVLGGYGFSSARLFRALMAGHLGHRGELFMSGVVAAAIRAGVHVRSVDTPAAFAIGTPDQIAGAIAAGRLRPTPLTWVFDVDETLLSLPATPGDLATAQPLPDAAAFVRRLHAQGHRIVLHTATVDGGETGRQARDALLAALRAAGVPYDELRFGKPRGDVYVDGRATNPAWWHGRWATAALGFGFDDDVRGAAERRQVAPGVTRSGPTTCTKTGAPDALAGYAAFLRALGGVAPQTPLGGVAPRLVDQEGEQGQGRDGAGCVSMEWLPGVSVGRLNAWGTLTPDVMAEALVLLARFHAADADAGAPLPAREALLRNYMPKLRERLSAHAALYALVLSPAELGGLETALSRFFDAYEPYPAAVVHGDFWLHNLIWDPAERVMRAIDMRGRLGDELTTAGDRAYDYGKLLQSLSGFDLAVLRPGASDCVSDSPHIEALRAHAEAAGLDFGDVRVVCLALVLGALPFHPELTATPGARAATRRLVLGLADAAFPPPLAEKDVL
jgi:dTDP-glucose pyrophosphorylase